MSNLTDNQVLAIKALYPNVVGHRGLQCFDSNRDEVSVDMSAVNAWVNPNQYALDRAKAYPSLRDQLDMLYHDAVNGTTTWQEAVAAVKAAHPKPE